MKMIVAIVQAADADKVSSALSREGFMFTKVSSTGGFLKSGNTTLLIGVEDDKVDQVISHIRLSCSAREEILADAYASEAGFIMPEDVVKIMVGGATVFVLSCEQFVKI